MPTLPETTYQTLDRPGAGYRANLPDNGLPGAGYQANVSDTESSGAGYKSNAPDTGSPGGGEPGKGTGTFKTKSL